MTTRKRQPHLKVNLRIENILQMIKEYELFKKYGVDKEYYSRVLRQLKKKIYTK